MEKGDVPRNAFITVLFPRAPSSRTAQPLIERALSQQCPLLPGSGGGLRGAGEGPSAAHPGWGWPWEVEGQLSSSLHPAYQATLSDHPRED